MAVLKRVGALQAAATLLNDVSVSIRERLAKFCTDRAIQLGLSTKAFPQTFVLGSHNIVESRKTVGKLKTLLLRYILKLIPYVTFSLSEFIQVKDRQDLYVHLGVSESFNRELINKIRWHDKYSLSPPSPYHLCSNLTYQGIYFSYLDDYKLLNRYVRYLNYLFRKYQVPLRANLENAIVYDVDQYDSARQQGSATRSSIDINHTVMTGIKFSFVRWKTAHTTDYENAISTGRNDELFARIPSWTSPSLFSSRGPEENVFYRYSVEKIFLHMDKGLKMLTTLTRKVKYGSAAFSFGDNLPT
jgi:hypothetical protein